MQEGFFVKPVARIFSDFSSKFGIPRQSNLIDSLEATVVFEKEFRNPDALRGLEGFTHIWLLWQFSENMRENWSPTVRPPRLGGNERVGVFASRSPFRPNPIGLSCVRLAAIENDPVNGCVLRVIGADLMDGTPIIDIKPYLPFADCMPEAKGGFATPLKEYALEVDLPEEIAAALPEEKREVLRQVLSQDPRPAYHGEKDRIYGFPFAGFEIRFTVDGKKLTVKEIERL